MNSVLMGWKLRSLLRLVVIAFLVGAGRGAPQPEAGQKPAAVNSGSASTPMEIDERQLNLPESPVEQAEKSGKVVRLSLKDLTKLALQNNLDIAISDTNEELFQLKTVGAQGPYDPAITVGLGVGTFRRPNTNLTNRSVLGDFNQTDSANWNFGFTQNIPTGGGITATYNTSRTDTNQAFALFSPSYNPSASFTFTQPLRRNFRTDQFRSTIRLANLDVQINDSQFKQKVTDTIAGIQALYWDLVGAIQDYEIKRESVRLARITLENNKAKVEIGTLAPISITEAQADMASREVDLITGEEKINTTENSLRSMITSNRSATIWQQLIIPTEKPDYQEYRVEMSRAIDAALSNRPELNQLDLKLKQSEVTYQLNQNMRKWQFDVVSTFGLQGVAGPQSFDASGKPLIESGLVGNVFTAYKALFSKGFYNWSVGFNLQIPLRNRTVQSQLSQVKVQQRQLMMNRMSLEQQIQVDVRNAVQRVETSKKQIETARVARQLAMEQLDGEQKRFEAGMTENFRVLDRQRGFSVAQGVELQSLIAYRKALIALQKSMYTLLESNDFAIAKTSSESVPGLK
jgi:outer membrane protein